MVTVSNEDIREFLIKVDVLFPVPLSTKQNLAEYARKLYEKATVLTETSDEEIISMVAGYTKNVIDNMAYISVVATLPEYSGLGLARKLVERFIGKSKTCGLSAVHLYCHPTNVRALDMYYKIGFQNWSVDNESRPKDVHLIYHINRGE